MMRTRKSRAGYVLYGSAAPSATRYENIQTKRLNSMIQNHVTGGYFLEEDLGRFDAAFFNFTSDVASVS